LQTDFGGFPANNRIVLLYYAREERYIPKNKLGARQTGIAEFISQSGLPGWSFTQSPPTMSLAE